MSDIVEGRPELGADQVRDAVRNLFGAGTITDILSDPAADLDEAVSRFLDANEAEITRIKGLLESYLNRRLQDFGKTLYEEFERATAARVSDFRR